MQTLILDEDKPHILDLQISPDNPLYAGVTLKRGNKNNSYQLAQSRGNAETRIHANITERVAGMPSDYIILTGIAPTWVRLKAAISAARHASTIFHNDGSATVLISGGIQPTTPNGNLGTVDG